MCDDDEYVWITLQSGAAAYVLKNAPADELVKAIRKVMAGRRYLSPPLSDRAIDLYAHTPPPTVDETLSKSEQEIDLQVFKVALQNIDDVLTSREQEVLRFMAKGWTNADIAAELGISRRTVAHHIENLLTKMHVHNRTEAVAKASQWGWIKTDL
jgi:DNA-binding NarL/FixJ family response regulator